MPSPSPSPRLHRPAFPVAELSASSSSGTACGSESSVSDFDGFSSSDDEAVFFGAHAPIERKIVAHLSRSIPSSPAAGSAMRPAGPRRSSLAHRIQKRDSREFLRRKTLLLGSPSKDDQPGDKIWEGGFYEQTEEDGPSPSDAGTQSPSPQPLDIPEDLESRQIDAPDSESEEAAPVQHYRDELSDKENSILPEDYANDSDEEEEYVPSPRGGMQITIGFDTKHGSPDIPTEFDLGGLSQLDIGDDLFGSHSVIGSDTRSRSGSESLSDSDSSIITLSDPFDDLPRASPTGNECRPTEDDVFTDAAMSEGVPSRRHSYEAVTQMVLSGLEAIEDLVAEDVPLVLESPTAQVQQLSDGQVEDGTPAQPPQAIDFTTEDAACSAHLGEASTPVVLVAESEQLSDDRVEESPPPELPEGDVPSDISTCSSEETSLDGEAQQDGVCRATLDGPTDDGDIPRSLLEPAEIDTGDAAVDTSNEPSSDAAPGAAPLSVTPPSTAPLKAAFHEKVDPESMPETPNLMDMSDPLGSFDMSYASDMNSPVGRGPVIIPVYLAPSPVSRTTPLRGLEPALDADVSFPDADTEEAAVTLPALESPTLSRTTTTPSRRLFLATPAASRTAPAPTPDLRDAGTSELPATLRPLKVLKPTAEEKKAAAAEKEKAIAKAREIHGRLDAVFESQVGPTPQRAIVSSATPSSKPARLTKSTKATPRALQPKENERAPEAKSRPRPAPSETPLSSKIPSPSKPAVKATRRPATTTALASRLPARSGIPTRPTGVSGIPQPKGRMKQVIPQPAMRKVPPSASAKTFRPSVSVGAPKAACPVESMAAPVAVGARVTTIGEGMSSSLKRPYSALSASRTQPQVRPAFSMSQSRSALGPPARPTGVMSGPMFGTGGMSMGEASVERSGGLLWQSVLRSPARSMAAMGPAARTGMTPATSATPMRTPMRTTRLALGSPSRPGATPSKSRATPSKSRATPSKSRATSSTVYSEPKAKAQSVLTHVASIEPSPAERETVNGAVSIETSAQDEEEKVPESHSVPTSDEQLTSPPTEAAPTSVQGDDTAAAGAPEESSAAGTGGTPESSPSAEDVQPPSQSEPVRQPSSSQDDKSTAAATKTACPPSPARRSKRATRTPAKLDPSAGASTAPRPKAAPVPSIAPGMTERDLKNATTRNTRRNEVYFCAIDRQIVRVSGPRPPSPTSKIRSSAEREEEDRKADRDARARRRGRLSSGGDDDESESEAVPLVEEVQQGACAPGDEDEYKTPARVSKRAKFSHADKHAATGGRSDDEHSNSDRYVRWNRALTVIRGGLGAYRMPQASKANPRRSCLKLDSQILLDASGNPIERPVEQLRRSKVTVTAVFYDGEEPVPIPSQGTRSKSKSKK